MKITIHYPQVMKTQMSSQIEVSNSVTLHETKRLVLESFWKLFASLFSSRIGRHGTIDDISLQNRDVVILNDDDLKAHLSQPECYFEALFKVHPLSGVRIEP